MNQDEIKFYKDAGGYYALAMLRLGIESSLVKSVIATAHVEIDNKILSPDYAWKESISLMKKGGEK